MSDLSFSLVRKAARESSALPALQVRNLNVRVGIRRVLENVNLVVHESETVYVTGPNGSGKSTLLNAIAGIDPACIESGEILFFGTDITLVPPHRRAQLGIAYCRQRDNVFADMTVEENLRLALGGDAYTRFQRRYPDFARDLPPNKRASLCSGGQRQRLAIAMASMRPSRLLLADEPEAGLSQNIELTTHGTLLIVSHDFQPNRTELNHEAS